LSSTWRPMPSYRRCRCPLGLRNAVTIKNEPKLELWGATDGWVKRTSVKRDAYVLEDFRKLLVFMEWEGPEYLKGIIANVTESVEDEERASAEESEDDSEDSADDVDDEVDDDVGNDWEDDVEDEEEPEEVTPSMNSFPAPTHTAKPKRGRHSDGNQRKRGDW
jgi:hypothetical protein